MNNSLHMWLGACTPELDYEQPVVPLDVYTAASIGNCASISQALELSPTGLDLHNKGGWTALMYASYYGHHDAIMLLTSRGASVHARNHTGYTALMLATMCGYTEVVAALIKSGCFLEVRDSNTWTAVFHAVHSHQSAVLQLLLECGANANAFEQRRGESPLLVACREGDQTMVEALLRYGADPGLSDYADNTPGSVALAGQHHIIADIIAKSVATRGIISGLTHGSAFEDQLRFSNSDGGSLQRLLAEAGLAEHYPKLEEQAVDLQVFLTLTDSDLKECGISKLGPRRKMTALIGRWHSNAPLRSALEAAYADRLEVEKLELALKLSQANKELRTLDKKMHQEQELQLTTESLVVEARGRLQRCHGTSLQLAALLTRLYRTVLHANDLPSDLHLHYAASLCNAAAKKCRVVTSIEEPQSHELERSGVRPQIGTCGNGNVSSWDTVSQVGENTANCVASVVMSSAKNGRRRGYSDIPGAAAAASVDSKRSHDGNSCNGGTQNDARLKRCCDGVDANVVKRCSTNAHCNGIVSPNEAMLLADGNAVSTCKFWNENEVCCDHPDSKSTSIVPYTASSVSLKSDGCVFEKASGNKLIDYKTDSIWRPTDQSFYFNNVDNVSSFNLDKETVSTSNLSEAQKRGCINHSDTPCMPTNRVELDADCLISDMSRLDLNNVLLPSDYMTRPPRLCVPKLGEPLKECLEMVKALAALSDPNVPRQRAPETGPLYCATGDGSSVANNDDVSAATSKCCIPAPNDCIIPSTNDCGTASTDDRAMGHCKGPVLSAHDNCILVSNGISSNTGDVFSDQDVTDAVDDEESGIVSPKTNSSMLNYCVNTEPNSNISGSDENISNLTDSEKLKPIVITGEPKAAPNNIIQSKRILVEVTTHPLVDEPTANKQTHGSHANISSSIHHEILDDVSGQANISDNRTGHADSGYGNLLREERKGPLHKSKKDRNRHNIIRPSHNNKRKCELVSTPNITYCNRSENW